ncbi:MAG: rod shape-determining protein MreC [Prolixibacteraceae bacterium]|nr:rod shape-determining protein MreC [Ignavibacteriaceae bacterium]MCK9412400.1 rod shape-determining protein MreC [Prolixibacteraceae bacterium]
MRNLFRLILRYHYIFLFLILEIFSLSMVVTYNNYQQAKFLTSSNGISGYFFENFIGVFQVFDLKKANTELAEENAQLRTALQHYQLRGANNSRQSYLTERNPLIAMTRDSLNKIVYFFTTARVINNSINQRHNFLTINKGRIQGVKEYMGVVSAGRVVGLVTNVGDNYSTVISILNERWKLSAKIKRNDFFGSLSWNGKDYRKVQLNEIPYHVPVQNGDTIVTTGFSSSFPEGLEIGIVSEFTLGSGSNFYKIDVNLAVDFKSIVQVALVENRQLKEINKLESLNNDGK